MTLWERVVVAQTSLEQCSTCPTAYCLRHAGLWGKTRASENKKAAQYQCNLCFNPPPRVPSLQPCPALPSLSATVHCLMLLLSPYPGAPCQDSGNRAVPCGLDQGRHGFHVPCQGLLHDQALQGAPLASLCRAVAILTSLTQRGWVWRLLLLLCCSMRVDQGA